MSQVNQIENLDFLQKSSIHPPSHKHSQNIFVFIFLTFLIFLSYITNDAIAESQLSQSMEKRCIHLYDKFKMMGEEGLRERYPAITIMNSCLASYADNKWTFTGKDLIDKKYQPVAEIQADVKIYSKLKIGPTKYLTNINACLEKSLQPKYLQVNTDKEQFLGKISRPLNSSCVSFWVIMNAFEPENTQFSWKYQTPNNFKNVRMLF